MTDNNFLITNSLNESLHIQGITLFSTDFAVKHYHDNLYQQLGITFAQDIKGAVNKRKAEYLAGRYAAAQALKSFGVTRPTIPTGSDRSPIFPEGIVASISHTNTTALCAAGLSKNIKHLGIDLETILNKTTINEVEHSIINGIEKEILVGLSMPYENAFSIVFSAKESLFKALYSNVKSYFDFSAAQLVHINENENLIEFKLSQELSPTLSKGTRINGTFCFNKTEVLTCIYAKKA